MCRSCNHQFTGDHTLQYQGCHSLGNRRILLMLVRGIGIRDVSVIDGISIRKILSVLLKPVYVVQPKQSHYESLEADEFWT